MVPDSGGGLFTVNVKAADAAPPGLVTIMYGFPATAIALAGIEASNSVELMNVVWTFKRLKLTCEPCTNPFPVTVRIKPGPPAIELKGEIFETESWMNGGRIETIMGFEVPPPGTPFEGVITEIVAIPGADTSPS